jgi:hypothetical protein
MESLVTYYKEIASPPDLQRNYVYVALTLQPEANSSPLGGVFADLHLMVDLIARSVPDDWMVYVKEHPSSLHPVWAWRSQATRSRAFYEDIERIPKVQFVPIDTESYDLIDNARAVATLTGTSSWQAVNRGVPGMAFGYPWYRGCEGVYHIETIEACRQAIAEIVEGVEIDLGKIRLFVHALEQTSVSAYLEKQWREHLSFDSNPRKMADSIANFFQRKKKEQS